MSVYELESLSKDQGSFGAMNIRDHNDRLIVRTINENLRWALQPMKNKRWCQTTTTGRCYTRLINIELFAVSVSVLGGLVLMRI
jgi:hypothetical protein